MNYKEYSDNEILSYIAENNEDATNILYKKYQPVIKNAASKYYSFCKNSGIELNDLIQEGMVGLSKAIDKYKDNKEASFYTFASMCIERSISDMVTSTNRLKHKILNDSIPLEMENSEGENISLDNFITDNNGNPESILFKVEHEKNLFKKTKEVLTDFECQVFSLKYNGFDYREIAKLLDKEPKAIDNALQRIRIKINKILDDKN